MMPSSGLSLFGSGQSDLLSSMDHGGGLLGQHLSSLSVGSGGLEDQRALQLALELSMLGLTNSNNCSSSLSSESGHGSCGSSTSSTMSLSQLQQHHAAQQQLNYFTAVAANHQDELRGLKKSQNMTECVPVPSSEHVAEIVGRQGCKIKALRAKTNTYIKTPVRGEEPVFVVTGRKEDVSLAKREILSAAEHFSQIRASRKGGSGSANANGVPTCAPTPVPGQVTIQVRVPYRVVGLVVGPKGATIKRIQQQTHTYIVTPSRDKDPVFEVTGLPDNVQMAKREIEAHIAIRTGSLPMEGQGMGSSEDQLTPSQSELLNQIYKNGFQGLEGLGIGLGLGLGLGAINSLSSSLSSVSGLGTLGSTGSGNTVGSSSSGGGSLSSLSSLNGFSGGNTLTANDCNNMLTSCGNNGLLNNPFSSSTNHHNSIVYEGFGYSIFDSKWTDTTMTTAGSLLNGGDHHHITSNSIGGTTGGLLSSSCSEDSYLFGESGPNSIGGSQTKLSDLFVVTSTNPSVGSSLWGSFDRDEGLGDSPTSESAPTTLDAALESTLSSGVKSISNSPPPSSTTSS